MDNNPPPLPINHRTSPENLEADKRWRERRHEQWTTKYQLYRDSVITIQDGDVTVTRARATF